MSLTHLDCLNLAHWLHDNAKKDGLGPISFAFVDTQGELLWFERMDHASPYTAPTAIAKAYTAIRTNSTTQSFNEQVQKEQLSVGDFMDAKLTTLLGGAPLVEANGITIGALGISSNSQDRDQALANAAAAYLNAL